MNRLPFLRQFRPPRRVHVSFQPKDHCDLEVSFRNQLLAQLAARADQGPLVVGPDLDETVAVLDFSLPIRPGVCYALC